MTSSSPSHKSDQGSRTDTSGGRHCLSSPAGMLKEELRQSIMAKRQARGEKQLKIEYREPQQMALTPAEVEKKERRREQNRRAAQRCRYKKRINQKHVIQNYEQVVARNEELQYELDAVKRELNKLKTACAHHYACCPSFSKVKHETDHGIKLEPVCVDELQGANIQLSLCRNEYSSKQAHGANISRLPPDTLNTFVLASGSDKLATSSGVQDGDISTFSDKQQEILAVEPETDFLQPPHSHSADTDPQHPWSQTRAPDENSSPSSRMLSGFSSDVAAFLMSAQNHVRYLRLQRQECQLQPQQQIFTEDADNTGSNQPPEPVEILTMSSMQPVNTYSHMFLDCGGQVQAQNITYQVVPSLRSPRPDSVTSTTSCSYDTVRHRSLSGGSGCVSHTPRRCRNEREFSSVSSEGSLSIASMFQDMRTLEVPDMDTDDVFMNPTNVPGAPLDGLDDNNNQETLPDNNITMERELYQLITQTNPSVLSWLSTTQESTNSIRDDAARVNDTSNGIMDSEDVNPLISLPSDYLQILNDNDYTDQSYDLLSNILSGAQRVDY